MPNLVWVQWYATVLRKELMWEEVAKAAPLALRYGATQYSVQVSEDDRYKITQMSWFERKEDWYRFWDGPEMIEFRARNSGKYQIPISYGWVEEIASGALGPEVELREPEPAPEPAPQATV